MSDWELPSSVESTSIERVGGGRIWESGVYPSTVKMAYLDQAASEAVSLNIVLENSDGKELKETFYIRSGKEKGGKSYYTKDGKDFPLPGYSVANSLCIAATGQSIAKCIESRELKMVNVYDFEQRKEVAKERPVLMALLNKKITVAVHQILENKTKKNPTTKKYEPTGETRNINECKFFGNADGKTAEEILNNSESVMFDKWAEKNTGNVIDKSTKNAAGGTSSAADIMGGGASTSTEGSSTTSTSTSDMFG